MRVLAAQIDDGIAAVFVTFALTALFAVVGWTLKQAFSIAQIVRGIESQVADHERRLHDLEHR